MTDSLTSASSTLHFRNQGNLFAELNFMDWGTYQANHLTKVAPYGPSPLLKGPYLHTG